ncbi:MAG: mhpC [Deltaproteobacteria bacterium]|nr:mhpC [Deltaproteobacteria bacterium]
MSRAGDNGHQSRYKAIAGGTIQLKRLPKELLHKAGQYPQPGRKTAALIPGAKLVELPDIGHIPHLEAADRFQAELLAFLDR